MLEMFCECYNHAENIWEEHGLLVNPRRVVKRKPSTAPRLSSPGSSREL